MSGSERRSTIRSVLTIGGLAALILGIVILLWPTKSIQVVVALIAIYAIIVGIVYLAVALTSSVKSGWSRIGNGLLGLLYIIAGIVFFANLGSAAATLMTVLGIILGIMWIAEGVMAFTTLPRATTQGWSIFYGIVTIIAGIVVLTSPFWAMAALWWMLGVSLVVMGALQLARSFKK